MTSGLSVVSQLEEPTRKCAQPQELTWQKDPQTDTTKQQLMLCYQWGLQKHMGEHLILLQEIWDGSLGD